VFPSELQTRLNPEFGVVDQVVNVLAVFVSYRAPIRREAKKSRPMSGSAVGHDGGSSLAPAGRKAAQPPGGDEGLLLGADEITHRRDVGGVARKCQAAEGPAILDRCQHRVVVVGHV